LFGFPDSIGKKAVDEVWLLIINDEADFSIYKHKGPALTWNDRRNILLHVVFDCSLDDNISDNFLTKFLQTRDRRHLIWINVMKVHKFLYYTFYPVIKAENVPPTNTKNPYLVIYFRNDQTNPKYYYFEQDKYFIPPDNSIFSFTMPLSVDNPLFGSFRFAKRRKTRTPFLTKLFLTN
jgi:hypothetical protein